MKEPVWMEVADAVIAHDAEIATHGGSKGIREMGLLESALALPRNLWAYSNARPSLHRLAAAYAFGISSNHPFLDGHKRTALVVSFAFCEVNGLALRASQEDAYVTFTALAAGEFTEEQLAAWFVRNTGA